MVGLLIYTELDITGNYMFMLLKINRSEGIARYIERNKLIFKNPQASKALKPNEVINHKPVTPRTFKFLTP